MVPDTALAGSEDFQRFGPPRPKVMVNLSGCAAINGIESVPPLPKIKVINAEPLLEGSTTGEGEMDALVTYGFQFCANKVIGNIKQIVSTIFFITINLNSELVYSEQIDYKVIASNCAVILNNLIDK